MQRSTRSTGPQWRQTRQPVQAPQAPILQQQQEEAYKTENMDYYANNKQANAAEAMETTDNGQVEVTEKKIPPWKKVHKTADGRIIKKKKDPNAVHLRLKRYVQPKNAAMCLNELKKVNYVTETEAAPGQQTCCVVVEVDGQEFRGYGSSKQLAKQAAAEAALVSFVKPPSTGRSSKVDTDEEKGEDGTEKDSTPWAVLASFAMYKLFNDWREGRVGMCSGQVPLYGGSMPSNMAQALQQLITGTHPVATGDAASSAISAYLNKSPLEAGATTKPPISKRLRFPGQEEKGESKQPMPAKSLPTNAASMHPVMLLHQMRPSVVFDTASTPLETEKTAQKLYTITADIDGNTYVGEGTNIKKAKVELALKANEDLFGIVSTWEPVGKATA